MLKVPFLARQSSNNWTSLSFLPKCLYSQRFPALRQQNSFKSTPILKNRHFSKHKRFNELKAQSEDYLSSRNFLKALEMLTALVQQYPGNFSKLEKSKILEKISECYNNLGFYDLAFTVAKDSKAIHKDEIQDSEAPFKELAASDEGMKVYKLIQGYKFGESFTEKAKLDKVLAKVHLEKSDYSHALELATKALEFEINQFGENHIEVARSYELIGQILDSQQKLNDSLHYYQKALDLKIDLHDSISEIGETLLRIGMIYQKLSEYDKALEHFIRAYNYFKVDDNQSEMVKACNKIGDSYQLKGNPEKASEYYQMVLDRKIHLLASGREELYHAYKNIAKVYSSQAKFKEALHYNLKCFEEVEKSETNKEKEISDLLIDIGDNYQSLALYDDALDYFSRAFNLLKNDEKSYKEKIFVLDKISQAQFLKNDPNKAMENSLKAINLAKCHFGENSIGTADQLLHLAKLHESLMNFKDANDLHQKVLKIQTHQLGKECHHVANTHYNLAILNLMHQRDEEARKHFNESMEMITKIYNAKPEKIAKFIKAMEKIFD